jgi:hypothetical protein
MKFLSRNTVRIHSWGGLGSQLIALGVLLDLRKSHPRRDLMLIIHSSGVTRRVSEIDQFSNLVKIIFIDDFVSGIDIKKEPRNFPKKNFHIILKKILNFTRLVISKDSEQIKLMPWTRSIRCHHGMARISRESIRLISTYIPGASPAVDSTRESVIGIHFRAGDLRLEKSSSLTNFSVITDLVADNVKDLNGVKVELKILSDSPIDPNSEFHLEGFDYTWDQFDTWDTFGSLITTNSFIGTNSKISLWVALFRWSLEVPGKIQLPESLYNQFKHITNVSFGDNFFSNSSSY